MAGGHQFAPRCLSDRCRAGNDNIIVVRDGSGLIGRIISLQARWTRVRPSPAGAFGSLQTVSGGHQRGVGERRRARHPDATMQSAWPRSSIHGDERKTRCGTGHSLPRSPIPPGCRQIYRFIAANPHAGPLNRDRFRVSPHVAEAMTQLDAKEPQANAVNQMHLQCVPLEASSRNGDHAVRKTLAQSMFAGGYWATPRHSDTSRQASCSRRSNRRVRGSISPHGLAVRSRSRPIDFRRRRQSGGARPSLIHDDARSAAATGRLLVARAVVGVRRQCGMPRS